MATAVTTIVKAVDDERDGLTVEADEVAYRRDPGHKLVEGALPVREMMAGAGMPDASRNRMRR